MTTYKLCYFDARGFAEISRWIFAEAGQEYEDFRWSREDWPKYKADSPTGKSPWLEVDGVKIAQSSAIARYLAKQFGLAGKTDLEAARIDMVAGCYDDWISCFRQQYYEQDEEKKKALTKKIEEENAPEYLQLFQNLLEQNGGDGYMVGDGVTWCDFQIVIGLGILKPYKWESMLDKYPKLKAFKERIESRQKIAEWIAKRPDTEM